MMRHRYIDAYLRAQTVTTDGQAIVLDAAGMAGSLLTSFGSNRAEAAFDHAMAQSQDARKRGAPFEGAATYWVAVAGCLAIVAQEERQGVQSLQAVHAAPAGNARAKNRHGFRMIDGGKR